MDRVGHPVSEDLMFVLLECPEIVPSETEDTEKSAPENQCREEIPMEPSVWKRLPEEILELIMARLPLKSILRLRTVCHKWNKLPLSKKFARLHSIFQHFNPGFVMCATKSFMRSKDMEKSGSNLGHRIGITKWLRLPFKIESKLSIPSDFIRLEASAGNLLCFSQWRRGPVNYYVCNPVTRCCKSLPERVEKGTTQLAGMTVDVDSGHYKVLIAVSAGGQTANDQPLQKLFADVYDSRTDQWKRAAKMSPLAKLVPGSLAVFCRGEFFWLVSSQSGIGLLIFNMEREDWRVIYLPTIIQENFYVREEETLWRYGDDRCELVLRSLEDQGRVFALLNYKSSKRLWEKRLWELIRAEGSWAEITLPANEPSLKPKDFILCSKPVVIKNLRSSRISRKVFLFDVLDGKCRRLALTDCSFGMLVEQQVPIPLNLGLAGVS